MSDYPSMFGVLLAGEPDDDQRESGEPTRSVRCRPGRTAGGRRRSRRRCAVLEIGTEQQGDLTSQPSPRTCESPQVIALSADLKGEQREDVDQKYRPTTWRRAELKSLTYAGAENCAVAGTRVWPAGTGRP